MINLDLRDDKPNIQQFSHIINFLILTLNLCFGVIYCGVLHFRNVAPSAGGGGGGGINSRDQMMPE